MPSELTLPSPNVTLTDSAVKTLKYATYVLKGERDKTVFWRGEGDLPLGEIVDGWLGLTGADDDGEVPYGTICCWKHHIHIKDTTLR